MEGSLPASLSPHLGGSPREGGMEGGKEGGRIGAMTEGEG